MARTGNENSTAKSMDCIKAIIFFFIFGLFFGITICGVWLLVELSHTTFDSTNCPDAPGCKGLHLWGPTGLGNIILGFIGLVLTGRTSAVLNMEQEIPKFLCAVLSIFFLATGITFFLLISADVASPELMKNYPVTYPALALTGFSIPGAGAIVFTLIVLTMFMTTSVLVGLGYLVFVKICGLRK